MDVTAEGIETERDLDLVRGLGAAYGQGYLFSRPLPADKLTAWWLERTGAGIPAPGIPAPAVPAPSGAPAPAGAPVAAGDAVRP